MLEVLGHSVKKKKVGSSHQATFLLKKGLGYKYSNAHGRTLAGRNGLLSELQDSIVWTPYIFLLPLPYERDLMKHNFQYTYYMLKCVHVDNVKNRYLYQSCSLLILDEK